MDTNDKLEQDNSDESDRSVNTTRSQMKLPPVVQLANAMESGTTAITTTMASGNSNEESFRALTNAVEQQMRALHAQQEIMRHF
ncbi:hypothetical protein GN958_ATG02236 [Phytophthora infestans]|uniref:Uncharacterized protein n=1 Tax=Phytophthora infestans TaxID=4787 RepID=A0A8S9VB32_PHYIN|nr:hypothetical protein GN958_ATG02236 [Phytophthora infestans]